MMLGDMHVVSAWACAPLVQMYHLGTRGGFSKLVLQNSESCEDLRPRYLDLQIFTYNAHQVHRFSGVA